MVRILNFACFALAALCCLALYRVSEQTRVARIRMVEVEKQISGDHDAMKVLQADWERVSEPSRIQALAQSRLGLSDTATVALASLDSLPRRGDGTPLTGQPVQAASIVASSQPADPHLHLVAAHAGN
ncbi:MAG: cell division protein FtsL [Rhizomicrobium sp.]